MNRFRCLLAAALFASLAACNAVGPDDPVDRTLLVAHHAQECMGPWEQLCLLVREPGQAEFTRHYHGIEGFAFVWGTTYEIEVRDHRIANPPQDGSSVRRVLRRVLAQERVPAGTEFEIFLTAGEGRVVETAPDRYRFYDAAEFICPAGAACSELRAQVAAGARMRFRFQHPAAPETALSLVRWEVCDRRLVGSNACSH